MIKATGVVLRKNGNTQYAVPVRRISRLVKLASAICPEMAMTLAK